MTRKPHDDQTSGDDEGFETGPELSNVPPNAPAPVPAPAPRSRVRLLVAALLAVAIVVLVIYAIAR
jgi:hypothetical protein